MALILAIEPDRAQAEQLTKLIDARLRAELLLATTTEEALAVVGSRVPDLVLVPALLSPQDDAALAGALRVIAAAARVRMLTIPVLAGSAPPPARRGMLAKWRRRGASATPNGCEPAVFAEQIAAYLAEAAAERPETCEIDEAPVLEPRVEAPIATSIEEPIALVAGPAAAPIEEPIAIAQPTHQSIVLPLEAAIVLPVVLPITEPVEEPIAIAQSTDESIILPVVEPIILPVEEPTLLLVEEPIVIAESAQEWIEVPLDEPFAESVEEPIAPAIEEPRAEPIDEPISQLIARLIEQPIVKPITEPIVEPVAEPVDEPIAALPPHHAQNAWRGPRLSEVPAIAARAEQDAALAAAADVTATADTPSVSEPLEPLVVAAAAIEEAPALQVVESVERAPAIAASSRPPVEEPPEPEYVSQAELDRRFFAAGGQNRLHLGSPAPVARPTPAPAAVAPALSSKVERPEWIQLIESLRLDVERLRVERAQPAPVASVPRKPRPAKERANQPPPTESRSSEDQWGLFDPEQCGFAALVAKLDEITETNPNVSA